MHSKRNTRGLSMFTTKNLVFKNLIFYNDIVVEKSKINFITGASGSGKSTLLKLLNRTQNCSAGEIFYKEKPITEYDSISLRNEVRLISQTTFLFPGTIRENFNLFREYCKKNVMQEEEMLYYLRLTEAEFALDSFCEELSGGERQRVYLAICLCMGGQAFLLDEPTSALDSNLSDKVLGNITQFTKKNDQTLVVISHDNSLVTKFAEHIIDLNEVAKYE